MGNYNKLFRHNPRPWRHSRGLNGQYAGIELETSHRNGYQQLLRMLPDPPPGQEAPSTEHDGSLNERTGLEIVFPPYKYTQIRHKNSFFRKAIRELNDGGARAASDLYGMHVNINTAHWTEQKRRLFAAIIDWMPGTWLQRIGGRRTNHYCYPRRYFRLEDYVSDLTYHGVVHIKSDGSRAEVRFPKSTTDEDAIVLVLDFLDLVEKFIDREAQTLVRTFTNDIIRESVIIDMFSRFLRSSRGKRAKKILEVLNANEKATRKNLRTAAVAAL